MSTNRTASENSRLPSSSTWKMVPAVSLRRPERPARTVAPAADEDDPMVVIDALLVPLPGAAHERVAEHVEDHA